MHNFTYLIGVVGLALGTFYSLPRKRFQCLLYLYNMLHSGQVTSVEDRSLPQIVTVQEEKSLPEVAMLVV